MAGVYAYAILRHEGRITPELTSRCRTFFEPGVALGGIVGALRDLDGVVAGVTGFPMQERACAGSGEIARMLGKDEKFGKETPFHELMSQVLKLRNDPAHGRGGKFETYHKALQVLCEANAHFTEGTLYLPQQIVEDGDRGRHGSSIWVFRDSHPQPHPEPGTVPVPAGVCAGRVYLHFGSGPRSGRWYDCSPFLYTPVRQNVEEPELHLLFQIGDGVLRYWQKPGEDGFVKVQGGDPFEETLEVHAAATPTSIEVHASRRTRPRNLGIVGAAGVVLALALWLFFGRGGAETSSPLPEPDRVLASAPDTLRGSASIEMLLGQALQWGTDHDSLGARVPGIRPDSDGLPECVLEIVDGFRAPQRSGAWPVAHQGEVALAVDRANGLLEVSVLTSTPFDEMLAVFQRRYGEPFGSHKRGTLWVVDGEEFKIWPHRSGNAVVQTHAPFYDEYWERREKVCERP